MKKFILTIVIILFGEMIFAQSPQSFKYQAVARNLAGDILAEQNLSFRISILESSVVGTAVYVETHTALTNPFGLVNLEIGSGIEVSGIFAGIDWGINSFFLQIEMDETGGINYQLMGSSQLLSVPYALYSENTANPDDSDWTISGDDIYSGVSGNVGIGTTTPIAKLEVAGHIATSNTGGSVFLGNGAGGSDDLTNNINVFIGEGTGQSNSSGYYNTACGGGSFAGNLTGIYNSAFGYGSLNANSSGGWNIAIGSLALEESINGNSNSAVGHFASAKSTSGDNNTSLGYTALHNNVTGSENTVIGSKAGYGSYNSSINGCVFLGYDAGSNENTDNKLYIENSSSSSPLIYGEFDNNILAVNGKLGVGTSTPSATLDVAGHIATSNTGGSVFLGNGAGGSDDLTNNINVFIGEGTGQSNSSGYYNTACGGGSFVGNLTGIYNSAFGYGSLNTNLSGGWNIAIGSLALEKSINGNSNSAVGHFASAKSTSGDNNTSLGYTALHNNVTGSENTVVGSKAGYGSYNSSINGCVFLGYNAGSNENTDNKLYIENSSSSSPLIYGEFDNDILAVNGNLGIGTQTPAIKLQVAGGTDATLADGGFILAGNTTGENIVIDNNEIMARNNGAISSLHMQRNGGAFNLHYDMTEIYEFAVTADGKTGIGENAPNSKLHINANSGENGLRVEIAGVTKLLLASNGSVALYNASAPVYALELQNSSADLYGRARAYSWNVYSDDRLKSNQRSIEYGLKEVMQLQPKSYDHHSSSTSENGEFVMVTDEKVPAIGFIAQEMQQVIPEAVSEPQDDSKNLWSMDYDKLIPVLTRAIQEQQEIIDGLLSRIETLESK